MFTGKTLSVERMESFFLVVHSPAPPDDGEWEKLIGIYCVYLAGQPSGDLRVVVVTHGGSPNAAQRRRMTEALPSGRLRTAVVTASLAVRTVVTGFRWFHPETRAFHPDELAPALSHVGASPAVASEVRARADDLYAQMSATRKVVAK